MTEKRMIRVSSLFVFHNIIANNNIISYVFMLPLYGNRIKGTVAVVSLCCRKKKQRNIQLVFLLMQVGVKQQ